MARESSIWVRPSLVVGADEESGVMAVSGGLAPSAGRAGDSSAATASRAGRRASGAGSPAVASSLFSGGGAAVFGAPPQAARPRRARSDRVLMLYPIGGWPALCRDP